ncbi:putative aminodeoxychorismate lyase [compost metagenome]
MNDILPPNRQRPQAPQGPQDPRPLQRPAPAPVTIAPQVDQPSQPLQPVGTPEPTQPQPLAIAPKRSMSLGKRIALIITGLLVLFALVGIAAFAWYQHELSPVSSDENVSRVRVTIESGTTPDEIGSLLASEKVIRNTTAFEVYTRLSGTRNKLQAGTFSLSPHESTAAIVDHLVAGKTDQFSITFLPGATVTENKKVFLAAGYEQSEIESAFAQQYTEQDSPLFRDKPASADLEGYIYGETYTFSAGSTVKQILQRTFDEFYAAISADGIIPGIESQGLNLYQGIIMASIIQREVPNAVDQKQVAQIFLKRYREGMELGSDITAYYGADKLGVPRTVAVDSPYNTRIKVGLPPGPIATPGLTALQAVAMPTEGDYVYFLSGDDDVTYYARTNEEHEKNIVDHCTVKCAME